MKIPRRRFLQLADTAGSHRGHRAGSRPAGRGRRKPFHPDRLPGHTVRSDRARLARPGGNITGVFLRRLELAGKQLKSWYRRSRSEPGWPSCSMHSRPTSSARRSEPQCRWARVQPLKLEKPRYDIVAASETRQPTARKWRWCCPVRTLPHRGTADRRTGDRTPSAHNVHVQALRRSRRADVLRRRLPLDVSKNGGLRRPNSQRSKARRSPD